MGHGNLMSSLAGRVCRPRSVVVPTARLERRAGERGGDDDLLEFNI